MIQSGVREESLRGVRDESDMSQRGVRGASERSQRGVREESETSKRGELNEEIREESKGVGEGIAGMDANSRRRKRTDLIIQKGATSAS